MSGTILENLSSKKLTILVLNLLLLQLTCFLVGGLIAPIPSSVQTILGTICHDVPGHHNNNSLWIYSRGNGSCKIVNHEDIEKSDIRMANQIVFVFQMPLPREGRILDYSRWQQNLIGILQPDIVHHKDVPTDSNTILTIDARLAYKNIGDEADDWKYYASSVERRNLDCERKNVAEGYLASCEVIPLFELGSLHHDFYLLNIRLPVDTLNKMNLDIGHVYDMYLALIYQNGGFTKVWVSLKTTFFPFIVMIMIWFWRRVHMLQRGPALLEYMLIYLGGSLTFLNLPLEYLTLVFDMPFMPLLNDIRQGIFYATLLSFWLVFAGEHMLIQETGERNSLKIYWKHLSAVVVGCSSMFIFEMCERGLQLKNPFFSIWVSKIGGYLALAFIILTGICAGIYFLFLCYMIFRVFKNISIKRTSLPSMSAVRRLHYEGIIYRFQFLMLATLLCAALTVIGFILGQVSDGQWKWNENIQLEFTSALFTGVYGMWNIYIFALMILYAPSHKQWPTENCSENIISEEIEMNGGVSSDLNPNEISSLTSFVKKAALD